MFPLDRPAIVALQRDWTTLHAGDSLILRGARGRLVAVALAHALPGEPAPARIWLTEEGCADDVFLHPGEEYRIVGDGRVALTAWGPARVRLASAADRPIPAGSGAAAVSLAARRRSAPASRPGLAPRPAALRP